MYLLKTAAVTLALAGSIVAGLGHAVINAGTPDAAIMVYDAPHGWHYSQLEYLGCVGNPNAIWFEDASAVCDSGARARIAIGQLRAGAEMMRQTYHIDVCNGHLGEDGSAVC